MFDYAYYNGVVTPYDAAAIPLSDRAVFFGDAVYDVMIGAHGIPYQLDEHIDRLLINAKRIFDFELPEKTELFEVVFSLIEAAGKECFTLYIQLSAYNARRSHLRSDKKLNILATITDAAIPQTLETVSAITMPDLRHRMCDTKTTNLLYSVMSVSEAEKHNSDVAIFYRNKKVTECSSSNLVIYKGDTLFYHPYDMDILPGITQQNLIEGCKKLGFKTKAKRICVKDLYKSDFVLLTSTTKLVKICDKINDVDLLIKNISVAKSLFELLLNDFSIHTNKF